MTIPNMDWVVEGSCRGQTALFFPPNAPENSKERRIRTKIALDICRSCPVIIKCREYARKAGEQGIWGGETDEDRWNAGYMRNNSIVAKRFRARGSRTAVKLTKT